MAYIGNGPISGTFEHLDSIDSLFDSIETSFDCKVDGVSINIGSSNNLLVIKNNAVLIPFVDYNIGADGKSIVFSVAPSSGDAVDIRIFGQVFNFPSVANGTITESKIVNGAVSVNKVAASAITESKLASNSVSVNKIVNGSVTIDKLASNSVSGIKILDGSVSTSKLDVTLKSSISNIDTLSLGLSGKIISGLTLSNNSTDAVNDIDISTGRAVTTAGTVVTLSSGITKRIDASWVAGTGNGGLDTGTVADGTYHIWLIIKDSDNSLDALFSLSDSSPTLPVGYSVSARLGCIIRSSGSILSFTQINREFWLATPLELLSGTINTTENEFSVGPQNKRCTLTVYCQTTNTSGITINVYNNEISSYLNNGVAWVRQFSGLNMATNNQFQQITTSSGTLSTRTITGNTTSLSKIHLVSWVDD